MPNTIKTIPNVFINGSSKAFNGNIFSVDHQVGITEPSKLTLSFLSEDGTYNDPLLSVQQGQGYHISIGSTFKDIFYAYRSELTQSSQGRRLDVSFFDGSIILDQTWVGLHKKMGDKYSQQPPSLIILGSETNPCDINNDRVFDAKDIALIQYDNQADPCNLKCPGQNAEEFAAATSINPILIQCQQKYLFTLLDVQYNFAELIYYIKQKGIKIITPYSIKKAGSTSEQFIGGVRDYYYDNFTGSLRDVLTRWCDELALIYYWENGGINFLDVSKRPKINLPNLDCITDKITVKTLEGTIAQGAITYYGREGEVYNNDCIDPQKGQLTCLTLTDLYGAYYKPTITGGSTGTPESDPDNNSDSDGTGPQAEEDYIDDIYPDGVPTVQFEISCICSYYDERLRLQNLLYNYYNIQDVNDAFNIQNKRLDRLGGMKIINIFSAAYGTTGQAAAGINVDSYNQICKAYINAGDLTNFTNESGYFVLVEVDKTKLEEQFHVERNLAANFIGKHWIKAYYQAYQGAAPEISPVGQYYAAGNVELKDLEFTQFYHSNDSKVAQLAQEFKKDPRNNGFVIDDPSILEKNILSLLYYQKNAVWSPDLSRVNPFKTLLDSYQPKLPHFVDVPATKANAIDIGDLIPTGDGVIPVGLTKDDYAKTLAVLAFYPGYEFTVTQMPAKNPGEEDEYYQLIPSYRKSTNSDWPRLYFGLTGKDCYLYTINGVPVFTPAGASANYNIADAGPLLNTNLDGVPNPSDSPSFIVSVGVSQKPHIQIGKIETTLMSPPPSTNCMKVEYVVKNVNDNNIAPLNNISADATGVKKCTLNLDTIKQFHTNLNEDLTFSITDEFVSEKITIPGLDLPNGTAASISKGLENFSVRLDESSAVVTTYSFGNSLFKKVASDVRIKALELGIKDLQNQSLSSFFQNITPPDPALGAAPNVSNQTAGSNYATWTS